jgi:hypothetical protein
MGVSLEDQPWRGNRPRPIKTAPARNTTPNPDTEASFNGSAEKLGDCSVVEGTGGVYRI